MLTPSVARRDRPLIVASANVATRLRDVDANPVSLAVS
jgi:hypothetical protein